MKNSLHQTYTQESVSRLPAGFQHVEAEWTSPSNIALIKYWGKSAGQIPRNPSLSFSLKEAVSRTKILLSPSPQRTFELNYRFENEANKSFESRIRDYIERLFPYFPYLKESSLAISSQNTFPHSSGIASSASGFSALALCLCSIDEKIGKRSRGTDFYRKASYLARLGSGSASRSVYGKFVSWGKVESQQGQKVQKSQVTHEALSESSDEYASPLDITAGPSFRSLCDAILILSTAAKTVTSSQGHSLMDNHPFAGQRYKQSQINYHELVQALQNDDIPNFIRITENEALMLHGLMLSSDPGFILLEPSSLEIITRIRQFREKTGTFLTFTIDAGPNIHLIYPRQAREIILDFIKAELQALCFEGKWIDDRMGEGPVESNL